MNYYQHHIGDFIRDTSRLSDSQSMAYLRLLWIYYETEQPIENDVDAVAFKIGANASDVQQIFKHFFFLHDDGLWHQARCDKEILAFRDRSEKAKKSADARWNNANAMRTHTDRKANAQVSDANQEPVTSNQEPIDKKTKQKNSKPDSWKRFFDAYPENKKGGTDASAWKSAQREGLDDSDFEAMIADVEKRKRLCQGWYATYALGITRYISERFWLTPIITNTLKNQPGETQHERITDEEFISQLDPAIARKLLAESPGDISSVEDIRRGRPAGVVHGIQAPALERVR